MTTELALLGATPEIVSGEWTDLDVVRLFLNSKRNPNTLVGYSNSVKMLVLHDAWKGFRDTTFREAFLYKEWLMERYAVPSVNYHVSVARGLHEFAVRVGHATVNPFAPFRAERVKTRVHEKILGVEDVLKLINAPGLAERHSVFLRMAYASGLRVSELCALTWADLNVETGVLWVRNGKGGKERFVTLPRSVVDKVLSIRGDSDRVFPWTPANAWAIVKKAARKAGVDERVSMHFFRHAHASHSLDRGAPLATVMKTLGHASIQSTSVYVHSKAGDSSALYLPV